MKLSHDSIERNTGSDDRARHPGRQRRRAGGDRPAVLPAIDDGAGRRTEALYAAAALGPRHLHPRRLQQLPLADDPAVPRRNRALRPLLGRRRVRLRPSASCGEASAPDPDLRATAAATATNGTGCTSTSRATSSRSPTCRRTRGSARRRSTQATSKRRCARCAALGVPYTDDEIAKGKGRARRQDRARCADRLSASARHGAEGREVARPRMDINDLRAVITVLAFVAFVGIVAWAYSRGRKREFDEAARLPFGATTGEDGAPINASGRRAMSDFANEFLELVRRGADASSPSSPAWCCSRARAPSDRRARRRPSSTVTCGTTISPSTTIRCRAGGCGSST